MTPTGGLLVVCHKNCNLPLAEAAKEGHVDVVRYLLDHGARRGQG
jgi:hypothetical protein